MSKTLNASTAALAPLAASFALNAAEKKTPVVF